MQWTRSVCRTSKGLRYSSLMHIPIVISLSAKKTPLLTRDRTSQTTEHHPNRKNSQYILYQSHIEIGRNCRVSENLGDCRLDCTTEKIILIMRIGTFNVRDLHDEAGIVQKIVDYTHPNVIGLAETWARPTDRFILAIKHESLSIRPTGSTGSGNAGIPLAWKPKIQGEKALKHKSFKRNWWQQSLGISQSLSPTSQLNRVQNSYEAQLTRPEDSYS